MAWNSTFNWFADKIDGGQLSAADVNYVKEAVLQIEGNMEAVAGNGTSAPTKTMQELYTIIIAMGAPSSVVKSANYTILDDDGYDLIFVDASARAVTITLPTLADNQERTITIKISTAGGAVTLAGEGAETIDGVTTKIMYEQYDFLVVRAVATEWTIIAKRQSMTTGWIKRSDWTEVHLGTVNVPYDGLSGTFFVGEKITGGSATHPTGYIISDSGSNLVVMRCAATGVFTNDEVITGSTSGATANVNVATSTKNKDSNITHNFIKNISEVDVELYYSSDGTENNSKMIRVTGNYVSAYGHELWQVDTSNMKIHTGSGGIIEMNDSGAFNVIDAEDTYYKVCLYVR